MEEDLIRYMKDPALLNDEDVNMLEKMAEEFPYFSLAQILLAKKYQLINHPNSVKQLSRAALVVNDRQWLHQFFYGKSVTLPVEKRIISEEKKVEQPESASTGAISTDEELREMLKSIHSKKQAILDSSKQDEQLTKQTENEFETEKKLIGDLSASQSELSAIEVDEESIEQQQKEMNEIDVMNKIENEIIEQLEFEEQEGLITLNETAGAGAEYVPTEFVEQEEQEEVFLFEQDAELQSFNVIEEEFYERELEFKSEEQELEKISSLESETEANEAQSLEVDISTSEIMSASVLEDELIDHESFETVESKIQDEHSQQAGGSDESQSRQDELKINETVESPGEFLPQKSYTFTQWLKFFSYEKLKKTDAGKIISKPVEVTFEQEEQWMVRNMEDEFVELDKMVSSIQQASAKIIHEKSAEELAKKSSEWDDELVSETLANVLEEQGSYDKAIRMYVKLSLRFPDKVSFFAARIKEIKSKK